MTNRYLLVCVASVLFMQNVSFAQMQRTDWSSFDAWERLLEVHEIKTVDSTPDLEPETTAIILMNPACDGDAARRIGHYIHRGGRLLLVTESRMSTPCLTAFGLKFDADQPRTKPSVPNTQLFRVLGRDTTDFGWSGLPTILANHPRLVTHLDGFNPVWTVAPGEGIGYHLKIGRGEAIILSDSSLFIDLMMANPGNTALAEALLDWVRQGRESYQLRSHSTLTLPEDMESAPGASTPIHPVEWGTLLGLSILMGIIIVGFALRFLWQTNQENRSALKNFPRPLSKTTILEDAMRVDLRTNPLKQTEKDP